MFSGASTATRVALLGVALTVSAWFGLGAFQSHYTGAAESLIQGARTPSSALTAKIERLLDRAGTLNPDRAVDLLHSQAESRAGRERLAEQIAKQVTVDEPRNLYAWIVLGFAVGQSDPAIAALAKRRELALAPPVRQTP